VNCLEFERLLDEGEPERLTLEAIAHARTCASCAPSLARARSLEGALESHFSSEVPVPSGFTDHVMARVERGEARGVRWLVLPDALPAWTRAAAEPSVALALVALALLMWRGDVWLAGARVVWTALAGVPGRTSEWLAAVGLGPLQLAFTQALGAAAGSTWAVAAGLVLGIAPLVLLGGWLAWRAGERLVDAVGAR
jgi:hypothetical protein